MSAKLIILGCGNSIGVPTIDGMWGNCNMNNIKNLRTRCSAIILKGSNSILIDTSPDIRNQLINNDIKNIRRASSTSAKDSSKSVVLDNKTIAVRPIAATNHGSQCRVW